MPTFIGYNTIDQPRKPTLTDFELVKRDLSNALNIRQGELPGRPGYGTTIWSMVFESQMPETQEMILKELQRVVSQDPRLYLAGAQIYPQENGVLIELQVQLVPSTTVERLNLFFDQASSQAQFV
jgi:phage baseplate assembly protein W